MHPDGSWTQDEESLFISAFRVHVLNNWPYRTLNGTLGCCHLRSFNIELHLPNGGKINVELKFEGRITKFVLDGRDHLDPGRAVWNSELIDSYEGGFVLANKFIKFFNLEVLDTVDWVKEGF